MSNAGLARRQEYSDFLDKAPSIEVPSLKLVDSDGIIGKSDAVDSKTDTLNDDTKDKIKVYLQPNETTGLSDDFSSQVLAQVIQYFQYDWEHREIMYPVMKDIIFPRIQDGYLNHVKSILQKSRHLDENDEVLSTSFLSSWSQYRGALESELVNLSMLIENFSMWETPLEDEEVIIEIARHAQEIYDVYFPLISPDSENMYG